MEISDQYSLFPLQYLHSYQHHTLSIIWYWMQCIIMLTSSEVLALMSKCLCCLMAKPSCIVRWVAFELCALRAYTQTVVLFPSSYCKVSKSIHWFRSPYTENYMCADKAWNSIHSVETQAKIEIIHSLAPQGKKATVHCTLFVYTFCMLPSSQQKRMYIGCLLGFTGWQSSRWACNDYYKIDVGGNK